MGVEQACLLNILCWQNVGWVFEGDQREASEQQGSRTSVALQFPAVEVPM